jgi:hypothetical protein
LIVLLRGRCRTNPPSTAAPQPCKHGIKKGKGGIAPIQGHF